MRRAEKDEGVGKKKLGPRVRSKSKPQEASSGTQLGVESQKNLRVAKDSKIYLHPQG